MSITISGVKKLWTLDFLYKKAVEEALRGYPLVANLFEHVRSNPLSTPTDVQIYHNASFIGSCDVT